MDALELEQQELKKAGKCGAESKDQFGTTPRRSLFCQLPKAHKGSHEAARNEYGLMVTEKFE